jgi:hypothetical protein
VGHGFSRDISRRYKPGFSRWLFGDSTPELRHLAAEQSLNAHAHGKWGE